MKLEHLINNTYQVLDNDGSIICFQGTYEECAHYIYNYELSMKQPTIEQLTERIDKLEQEVEWTREMIDILEEHIENMNSSDRTK